MPSDSHIRRPRFSLLTLALLLTIAALGFGLFASARRNSRLQAANRELAAENLRHRNTLGIFDIEEPGLVHAIRVPVDEENLQRFRVYLPPGRVYKMMYCANNIPEEGLADHATPQELPPGEYLVSVKLKRRYKPGTWESIRSVTMGLEIDPIDVPGFGGTHANIGISEAQNDWIVNNETGNMAYGTRLVGSELETHDPDEPLVLYRLRAQQVVVRSRRPDGEAQSYSTKAYDGPCDGFMVWLESQ